MSEQLEFRSAEVASVSFPRRLIELIVMPYNQETLVPHHGRMVRETVRPGAFDGIERRANRVRVNRDHDITRTVGRAVKFHPGREVGLVAELRIAQTELGEETLSLAEEDCLDASAGFLPMPGGERWEGRDSRILTKLWLGHIAMTPEPAYEGAQVLAVRSAAQGEELEATPNLDLVRSWRLQDAYDRIGL